MKQRFYDRTQALEAMYDLRDQGFTEVSLSFVNDSLMLSCKLHRLAYVEEDEDEREPTLDGDFVETYYTKGTINDGKPFWWIFD